MFDFSKLKKEVSETTDGCFFFVQLLIFPFLKMKIKK